MGSYIIFTIILLGLSLSFIKHYIIPSLLYANHTTKSYTTHTIRLISLFLTFQAIMLCQRYHPMMASLVISNGHVIWVRIDGEMSDWFDEKQVQKVRYPIDGSSVHDAF